MQLKGKVTLALDKFVISTQERAFKAFTDPVELSIWFTTKAAADLSIGGKYSNADGDHGEFIELDPPNLVAFTWENERHCPNTIVQVEFSTINGIAVRISLEHIGLRSDHEYEDMKKGWSWALDSFKSYLETGKPISYEDWLKSQAR